MLLQLPKLLQIHPRNPFERGDAAPGQADAYIATVASAWFFTDQAATRGALHQADDGVVPLLQEFGKLGDRGPPPPRVPGHAEEELILLGREATDARVSLAEAKEAAQAIAKPRQAAEGERFHQPAGGRASSWLHAF